MKYLIKFIPYFIISVTVIGVAALIVLKDKSAVEANGKNEPPLIIIDAGHGGKDGGAVAADGTQEQYINLDISRSINDILSAKGYKTIMTRKDNDSIHDADAKTIREQKVSDINNRLKIIQANPDCIFISIHQNYYTEVKYWGTQVFYSPNNILSSSLAQCIQSSVVLQLQPDNTRKIKESGSSIYLLYHAEAPAVMVECGFLSNYEETKKLNDDQYRKKMAAAICDGIINYINGGFSESETA